VLGEVVGKVLLDGRELFGLTSASVSQKTGLLLGFCELLNGKALLSEGKLLDLSSVRRIATRGVVRIGSVDS